jgi:hypothetical protein
MERPPLTPELAQAVSRLAQVREELKRLETEESLLREGILATVAPWPDAWFPVSVAGHELRRYRRPGRVDPTAAEDRLARLGLLTRVPRRPVLKDADLAARFPDQVATLHLDAAVADRILAWYRAIIEWQPDINGDLLAAWRANGTLPDGEYRACFRDGKPEIVVLAVR